MVLADGNGRGGNSGQTIGRCMPRVEDPPLLRGQGRFVDDLDIPGALHVAFLRSPIAHARLKGIDASKARTFAGVHAVPAAHCFEVDTSGQYRQWRYWSLEPGRAAPAQPAEAFAELFEDGFVLDKDAGEKKREHVTKLAAQAGCALAEVTFVDDKVNHLEDVAALGARCVLAGWGYNGPRERRIAEARGFLVCGLDDFEAQVFE